MEAKSVGRSDENYSLVRPERLQISRLAHLRYQHVERLNLVGRFRINSLTMATTTTLPPSLRSLYRRLLRELPPTPQPRHTLPRTSIHTSIRSHLSSSTSQAQTARLQELEQFIIYLRAQRMYGTLLHRYNPGMGMDEEERTRLSARRVGMNMPVEYGKMKK